MPLTNYTQLQAAVADWLARSSLAAQIPDFIALAEADFNSRLTILPMMKNLYAQLTAGEREYSLPADWRSSESLELVGQAPPRRQTIAQLRRMNAWKESGVPRYWATVGFSMLFAPAPGSAMDYVLDYYARFPALGGAITTNWMLANAPDVYLYGALSQAAPFLQKNADLPLWQGLYAAGLARLEQWSERAKWSGGPLDRGR